MSNNRRIETGIKEGYALWSKLYDHEKNPLIAIEEPYADQILKTLPYSRVLDAGTGTGRYALKLAQCGAHVTAIDISPEMLEVAQEASRKESSKITYLLASLENRLPFNSAIFDLVVCTLTLTHISKMANTIKEFHRVLKKEGHLLVTDFHPDGVAQGWRTLCTVDGITYLLPNMNYTRTDYTSSIKNAGFDLLQLIDVPIREVPIGYLPDDLLNKYSSVNLCLIILAKKL